MATYESKRYSFNGANLTGIPTSAVTSGTFDNARLSSSSVTQHVDLSNLSASNLTSGTVPNARVSSGSVNQHVDLTNLSASNLTSGTVPNARVSSGSVTQHVSATTNSEGTWTPSYGNFGGNVFQARYAKVGRLVHISLYGRRTSTVTTDNLASIGGLPFTSLNGGNPVGGGQMNADVSNNPGTWFITPNSGTLYMRIGAPGSSNHITSASYIGNLRGHDMAYIHYFIIQGTYIANS